MKYSFKHKEYLLFGALINLFGALLNKEEIHHETEKNK